MEVKLKRDWFYNVEAGPANDQRAISGGRYRKGTRTMPDELRPYLPSDAVVLDDDKPVYVEAVEAPMELVDEDLERASAEAEGIAAEKAEETRQALIKEKRVAAKAKARKAKKDKKDAK